MTAMKPVLNLIIDANVVLILAFLAWWGAQQVMRMGHLKRTYAAQLQMAKLVLVFTCLSPLLALGATSLGQVLWPQSPLTLGDLAVATYLKGGIAMPPDTFEALLTLRSRLLDDTLNGAAPWLSALAILFLLGAIGQMLRSAFAAWQIRRLLKRSHIWRRTSRTDVRLSDQIEVPFAVRGLFRRHVVLPSSILIRRQDLRIVLPHEFEHLRRGDVEWELGFEVMRPFFFWNPAFHLWKRAFDRLRELACDQALLSTRQITPMAYAECLLDYCERQLHRRAAPLHVAFVRMQARASRRALIERMLALQHQPTQRLKGVTVAIIVFVLAFGVSLSAAALKPTGDWSQDRLMLSTIINLERMRAVRPGF